MPLLLVMLGGALGAGGRHLVGRATLGWFGPGFPYGTITVNILGGLLMGLLVGTLARIDAGENVRLFLGVGVLGGFTTFSSFSLETWLLIEDGQLGIALLYIAASVVLSIAALVCGLTITRVF